MNIYEIKEKWKEKSTLRNSLTTQMRNRGFIEVDLGYFENYEEFLEFSGRLPKRETVKVLNPKGDVEILRPDITFNIIKSVGPAYKGEELKLFYDSVVFKAATNGLEERRQIGCEVLGELSLKGEVEMIDLIIEMLRPLTSKQLVIGHAGYINGLLDFVKNPNVLKAILVAIDQKQPQILRRLLENEGVSGDRFEKVMSLLDIDNTITKAETGYMNQTMKLALNDMKYLKQVFKNQIRYDLSLVSMFDYYSGVILKGFTKGVNEPIVKGGRYDKFATALGYEMPCVGFSLEFDEYIKGIK